MFCVFAKNISQLRKTLNEIKNKYGKYFSEQQTATIISGEFYPRDYLISKEKREKVLRKEFGEQTKRPKSDKEDVEHAVSISMPLLFITFFAVSIALSSLYSDNSSPHQEKGGRYFGGKLCPKILQNEPMTDPVFKEVLIAVLQ